MILNSTIIKSYFDAQNLGITSLNKFVKIVFCFSFPFFLLTSSFQPVVGAHNKCVLGGL